MKILVAPDGFKGSLSPKDAADSISRGVRSIMPHWTVYTIPLADGGEGTVYSFVEAAQGEVRRVPSFDPLMRPITSFYGSIDNGSTAVIELAASSGLALLDTGEVDPLKTTTYGTGVLIKAAIDHGARKIILGLGGSATSDCGTGIAQALGARFLDQNGNELEKGGGSLKNLHRIDLSGLHPKIKDKDVQVVAACDVNNPLTGPNGSAMVYGPQKGATEDMVRILEEGSRRIGSILKRDHGIDIVDHPGAGAAGGTGVGAMVFLNADLKPGFDLIQEVLGLDKLIKEVDLIITGEGMIDHQTLSGKAPGEIAALGKKHDIPVIGFCGKKGKELDGVFDKGFTKIYSLMEKGGEEKEMMDNAASFLEKRVKEVLIEEYS